MDITNYKGVIHPKFLFFGELKNEEEKMILYDWIQACDLDEADYAVYNMPATFNVINIIKTEIKPKMIITLGGKPLKALIYKNSVLSHIGKTYRAEFGNVLPWINPGYKLRAENYNTDLMFETLRKYV